MTEHFIESTFCKEDLEFDVPIRPQSLSEFAGQDPIRERLEVLVGAALLRGEPLGHCLFSGPPGLGKTTLANILAKALGTQIVVTSGPVIEKAGDLAGILTSLKKGDILFIDEIHRLNRTVEEYLYPAMEDFFLDLVIDSGSSARTIQVHLEKFTLVGATTRTGLLSSPLRSRFAFNCRLDYYTPEVLQNILRRTARILNLEAPDEALFEVAKRSRGTPRIANHLLRWVRDFAQMRTEGRIDREVVKIALNMLSIDEKGLDEMDKKLLNIMIDHYGGGPVGISTLAVAVGEESHTLEEVYEPYLILQGLIKRTPRGREITPLGYSHLGRNQTN